MVKRVDGLLRHATASLDCIRHLFESFNKHYSDAGMSPASAVVCGVAAQLLQPLLRHLKFDLLHDRAYAALRAVTFVIEPDLRDLARFLLCFRIFLLFTIPNVHLWQINFISVTWQRVCAVSL